MVESRHGRRSLVLLLRSLSIRSGLSALFDHLAEDLVGIPDHGGVVKKLRHCLFDVGREELFWRRDEAVVAATPSLSPASVALLAAFRRGEGTDILFRGRRRHCHLKAKAKFLNIIFAADLISLIHDSKLKTK